MRLSIAVLSDLHATGHPNNDHGLSYLRANPLPGDPNLFADLTALVKRNGLHADLLVCPGDICDKGDQIGFTYAWEQLQLLRSTLGAGELIATCGNHDLDSRYAASSAEEDPDPKGALLQATPAFPFGDSPDTDHFWARNYVIRQPAPGVTVVVLNTSAYHGGAGGELEHGRVSSRTIAAILTSLKKLKDSEINILVCHHHLQPLRAWAQDPDGQFVKKGVDLLSALSELSGSAWLVLHGHRHIPQILSSSSPAFMSVGAASFARIGDKFSNQFHLIEVESDPSSASMPLGGEITTWNWSRPKKWAQYHDPTKGLPPHCGFGYSGGVGFLVQSVENNLATAPFMDWATLTAQVPQLRYLTPEQSDSFRLALGKKGLAILLTEHGVPSQIGRGL